MFEYHGNNLKVDAELVSVTVELPEPLDIEKPLADLNLSSGKVTEVGQFVVSRDDLPSYMDDIPEEEFKRLNYHFFNGYTSSDWSEGVDYEGIGNEEVIDRAIPFLELGVRGLMTFCEQEAKSLCEWLAQAEIRSDELETAKRKN